MKFRAELGWKQPYMFSWVTDGGTNNVGHEDVFIKADPGPRG